MISVNPLFATPLLLSTENDLGIDIAKVESLPFRRMKNGAADWSESMTILDQPDFAAAKKLAELHLQTYFYEVMQIKKSIEPYITSSWIVKMNPGDHGATHHHTNSVLSGIMYLNVDQRSGDIVFSQDSLNSVIPDLFNLDIAQQNQFNSQHWACTPQAGMIVIFPSKLKHAVGHNQSNITRYSLAFNSFVRGKFGSDSDVLELA